MIVSFFTSVFSFIYLFISFFFFLFTSLQGQRSTTNEVVSILEVLDTNPEKAMVLLEEDSFHDSTSSHDQLTRLALTIETDENMSGVLEKEHLIHLQNKIKKLQASNKDICRDISNLRKNFQVIVLKIYHPKILGKSIRSKLQA